MREPTAFVLLQRAGRTHAAQPAIHVHVKGMIRRIDTACRDIRNITERRADPNLA